MEKDVSIEKRRIEMEIENKNENGRDIVAGKSKDEVRS